MKILQQFCATTLLVLVLSSFTFAGDMQFPGVNVPVGDPPAENNVGNTQAPGATADPATEIALGFLLDVSSLL